MDDPQARRPAGRPPRKPAPPKAPRSGRQVTLSPDAWRWLEVHALGRGCSISQLIEQWVGQQPSEFVLTRRSKPEPSASSPALGIVAEAG